MRVDGEDATRDAEENRHWEGRVERHEQQQAHVDEELLFGQRGLLLLCKDCVGRLQHLRHVTDRVEVAEVVDRSALVAQIIVAPLDGGLSRRDAVGF